MFALKSIARFLLVTLALIASAFFLPPILWWPLTLAYWTYEFGVTALMIVSTGLVLKRRPPEPSAVESVSVIIAAHNEADCILATLASVAEQEGVNCEILVASDGSTDGMNALVVREFPAAQLLALPKVGKAAALNAALAVARHDLVITLDADTRLAPRALARLAAAFSDPCVHAAGGWIFVRNATQSGWLVRWQFLEYIKNCLWRNGLAHLGVLLQVSGAFAAFRTETLRRIGGFDRDNLTEDYEIIYRMHRHFHEHREPYRILNVPHAVAYTEAPETFGGLIHQRTRWFTGFLRTLWDYRAMIGNPRFGRLGALMLPIKSVDAILPIWGLFSALTLCAAVLHPHLQMFDHGPNLEWIFVAFFSKWLVDISISLLAWNWHRRLTGDLHPPISATLLGATILTETWFFAWFRQIAVIRAYGWFFRGVKEWKQTRWKTEAVQPVLP